MEVDLSPVTLQLLQILATVLISAVGVVLGRLWNWLGLKMDSEVRNYLDQAIINGLKYGITAIGDKIDRNDNVTFQSQQVAKAVEYVVDQVPSAVKHFNLTPQKLEKLALARLLGNDYDKPTN